MPFLTSVWRWKNWTGEPILWATATRHFCGGSLEIDKWKIGSHRNAEPSRCTTSWDLELQCNAHNHARTLEIDYWEIGVTRNAPLSWSFTRNWQLSNRPSSRCAIHQNDVVLWLGLKLALNSYPGIGFGQILYQRKGYRISHMIKGWNWGNSIWLT